MDKFSDVINENKYYSSYEDFLISKKAYKDEKGYWNCDGNLMISEQYQNLFTNQDGTLKCKFGVIKGKFTFRGNQVIGDNTNPHPLASLIGMPLEVHGRFSVAHQKKIHSLIGCPKKVGGDIEFRGCKVTSLEGLPATCDNLILQNGQFKDLTGLTCSPRGTIDVSYGRIESLEGLKYPITCKTFYAGNSNLKTLKGIEMINPVEGFSFGGTKLPDWISDVFWKMRGVKGKDVFMPILTYMISNNMHGEIKDMYWPEGFINDELMKSANSIGKFKL